MSFASIFKRKGQKTVNTAYPDKPTTVVEPIPMVKGATVSIVTEAEEKLGGGVVWGNNPTDKTITVTRKTGELTLPEMTIEEPVKLYGCDRNTPFIVTGIVLSSTKTDLILGQVAIKEKPNQRAYFRVRMNENVTVQITESDANEVTCIIQDVSVAGARILSLQQLKSNSIIHMKAILEHKERAWRLDTDAEILREEYPVMVNNKTYYAYGVLFPQFNDREAAKFTQWLNMYQTTNRKQ